MKFFNTAGPVNQPDHYKLDPMTRWKKEEILSLIEQKKYFLLHAPRQTGKTSCLLALRDYLNKEGKHTCLYVNVESGQTARNDVQRSLHVISQPLRYWLMHELGDMQKEHKRNPKNSSRKSHVDAILRV